MEDDICKKFPKVCNCPYKDRIDDDFKNNGKTAYYVCKWLKNTNYPISYSALKKYYDYLKQNGEIKPPEPVEIEPDCIDEKLQKKLEYALDNIKFDDMNPNVQVQWVLGLLKIIRGDKHNVAVDGKIDADVGVTKYTTDQAKNFLKKLDEMKK